MKSLTEAQLHELLKKSYFMGVKDTAYHRVFFVRNADEIRCSEETRLRAEKYRQLLIDGV